MSEPGRREILGQNLEHETWRLVADATGYRLPTEAEWEYACRAGTTTEFASGSDEEMLRKYAVFQASRTASVASKLPNGWGLFDMHGNVWEWCWDRFGEYNAKSAAVDPTGAAAAPFRVLRGGGWDLAGAFARASNRIQNMPMNRYSREGFRVARGR